MHQEKNSHFGDCFFSAFPTDVFVAQSARHRATWWKTLLWIKKTNFSRNSTMHQHRTKAWCSGFAKGPTTTCAPGTTTSPTAARREHLCASDEVADAAAKIGIQRVRGWGNVQPFHSSMWQWVCWNNTAWWGSEIRVLKRPQFWNSAFWKYWQREGKKRGGGGGGVDPE